MDTELNIFGLLQTAIEVFHCSENTQPRAYCSLRIVFMGVGIAEIHQETIAQVLGNIAIVALDDFSTGRLIGTHHIPVLFGIESAGECGGIDQVAEHDGELAAFGVRGLRGSWRHIRLWRRGLLRDRELERLQRWGRGCREHSRPTHPHYALLVLADRFPVRIA
jgi:hypothetical protein